MEQNGPSGISSRVSAYSVAWHFVPHFTLRKASPAAANNCVSNIPFLFFHIFRVHFTRGFARTAWGVLFLAKAACNACACLRTHALVRWWPRLFRGKSSIEANSSKFNSVIGIGRIGARELSVCLFYNHQSIQHSRLFRDEPKLLAYFLQSPRHTQGVCWHPTRVGCA